MKTDAAEKKVFTGQAGFVYVTNVGDAPFDLRLGGRPVSVPVAEEEPYVPIPAAYARVVEKYGGRTAKGPLRIVQRRGGENLMQAVERTVREGKAELEAAKLVPVPVAAAVAPATAPDPRDAEKLVNAERSVVALEIENTKLARAADQAKRETEALKAELLKARQAAKAVKPVAPATE